MKEYKKYEYFKSKPIDSLLENFTLIVFNSKRLIYT